MIGDGLKRKKEQAAKTERPRRAPLTRVRMSKMWSRCVDCCGVLILLAIIAIVLLILAGVIQSG